MAQCIVAINHSFRTTPTPENVLLGLHGISQKLEKCKNAQNEYLLDKLFEPTFLFLFRHICARKLFKQLLLGGSR